MQGKDFVYFCAKNADRITPACAGKSMSLCFCLVVFRDHPCVCREKLNIDLFYKLLLGSPLRVQGKDKQKIGIYHL